MIHHHSRLQQHSCLDPLPPFCIWRNTIIELYNRTNISTYILSTTLQSTEPTSELNAGSVRSVLITCLSASMHSSPLSKLLFRILHWLQLWQLVVCVSCLVNWNMLCTFSVTLESRNICAEQKQFASTRTQWCFVPYCRPDENSVARTAGHAKIVIES